MKRLTKAFRIHAKTGCGKAPLGSSDSRCWNVPVLRHEPQPMPLYSFKRNQRGAYNVSSSKSGIKFRGKLRNNRILLHELHRLLSLAYQQCWFTKRTRLWASKMLLQRVRNYLLSWRFYLEESRTTLWFLKTSSIILRFAKNSAAHSGRLLSRSTLVVVPRNP